MKRISSAVLFCLLFLSALIFAQPTTWQALVPRIPGLDARRIAHLEQEWQVEETEPNILKMTHKEIGMVRYVDITDHQMDFSKLSPTVQVIDLINADTTLYNWKYVRKNMFAVGGFGGYPLVISDMNNNDLLDIVGTYKIAINTQPFKSAIIESQNDSVFTLQKIYNDSSVIPIGLSDMDRDSLSKLNFLLYGGRFVHNLESSNPDSFPDLFNFRYPNFSFNTGISFPLLCNLDNDDNQDAIFVAGDTSYSCIYAIYISEYVDSLGSMYGKIKLPN